MTEFAVWQLLHRGKQLAVVMPASTEGKLGWLGICPLDLNSRETVVTLRRFGLYALDRARPHYRIRVFEVNRALIEADRWLSEEDLENKHDMIAIGDEDLQLKLEELGVRLEQLEHPSNSDYPL